MTSSQFVGACGLLVLELIFATSFFLRQNKFKKDTAVGGVISVPKALWLSGAIFFWFFYPALFLFDPAVSLPWKILLALHLASWWTRGPLELFMIYKWFNWSPRYGRAHDLVHIAALVTGGLVILVSTGFKIGPADFRTITLVETLVVCISGEALFAKMFLAARGPGNELIYFADETERYKVINQLTWVFVAITYGFQIVQIFFPGRDF
jgi:hypothetical protein